MTHLGTCNHLEPFQSAYRKHRSTETALLHGVNNLLQASSDSHVSILSLFNLLAASDLINHVILSCWLSSNFGCTGTVLGWFESYLSNHMLGEWCSVCSIEVLGATGFRSLDPVYSPCASNLCYPAVRYHLPFFCCCFSCTFRVSSLVSSMTSSIEGGIWTKGNKLKMNDEKKMTKLNSLPLGQSQS